MVARVKRRSALPGPEWNPVLALLGLLAALTVLAAIHPMLGLAGILAAFVGACVYAFMVEP
jgi:hypothetical protein